MPKKIFQILILLSVVFFCCLRNDTQASSDYQIVINEIAWMGNTNSSNDEWIELRNLSTNEVNLESWQLVAQDGSPSINLEGVISGGAYYLLERSDDDSVSGVVADLIYSGALGNSGEVLELMDDNGNIVDSLDCSEGWFAGDNDTKQTMERKADNTWQTSLDVGGTPKAVNTLSTLNNASSTPETPSEDGDDTQDDIDDTSDSPDDANNVPNGDDEDDVELGEVTNNKVQYYLGDVVINEIVSDPADGDVEWIELYNNTSENINLENWTVEEGSGAKTSLEGKIGSSGEEKFFIIEKPKGNLNNSGDIIILRDDSGNLIDQVSYGDWDDGNLNNNATIASDPFSLARKIDGQNSFNNLNDFAVTQSITKKTSNIIFSPVEEEEEEVSAEEKANYDYSDDIVISEIFPNPEGVDSEGEFIELFNAGDREVDLTGWKLGDNSTRKYIFEALTIKAGEYLVIYRSESKLALNNSSDSVKLYQPLEDDPFIEVEYIETIEAWSYALKNQENLVSFEWTEVVTPGEKNIIQTINHAPMVDFDFPDMIQVGEPIIFDSSDTFDADEDELNFEWDFGDGIVLTLPNPEHRFIKTGNYLVKLTVSDGECEISKEKIVQVVNDFEILEWEPLSAMDNNLGAIVINEIFPNPAGSDNESEFIELKNLSSQRLNLLNWKIDDIEGGSKPYELKSDTWLNPESFFLLERAESKIALNNTNEAVRLFNNLDELIDELEYEKSVKDSSYARGENGKFFWTSVITPGKENVIDVSSETDVVSNSISLSIASEENGHLKVPFKIPLTEVKNLETGDLVITNGIVAVEPGVLGTQYFYIVDQASSTSTQGVGIQIYNYKKEFPALKVGDYIEVIGEISITNNEKRIKTSVKEDMVVLEKKEAPIPQEITCEVINEEQAGSLVSVSGEVVEKKSSTIYLDDGTDEVIVYVKTSTGINLSAIQEGDQVSITGLVGLTKSGVRIMPRFNEDIIKKDTESTQETAQVLGKKITDQEWTIAARDKKLELFRYLLIIAGGVILVLGGLLFRIYRRT